MLKKFIDLCEVKNTDNIVIKEEVLRDMAKLFRTEVDIDSSDDEVNKLVANAYLNKVTADIRRPDLKEYKLSSIELGASIFYKTIDHFDIINDNNMFRIHDVLATLDTDLEPNQVKFRYSYIIFQMGSE